MYSRTWRHRRALTHTYTLSLSLTPTHTHTRTHVRTHTPWHCGRHTHYTGQSLRMIFHCFWSLAYRLHPGHGTLIQFTNYVNYKVNLASFILRLRDVTSHSVRSVQHLHCIECCTFLCLPVTTPLPVLSSLDSETWNPQDQRSFPCVSAE